jgi:dTMP kinase
MGSAAYIAFEGAEASGKSTQAARLAKALGAVLTRETGGTAVGQRLRAILHDNGVVDLAPRAEALMAAADRAQHMHEVIGPALAGGRTVVSDRSVYSTLAYQGYGRGLDLEHLRAVNDWALQSRWPDLVLLIDVEPDVVEHRLRGRQLDRFERAGHEFHERVRHGYRAMAAAEPDRWVVLDGSVAIEAVAAAARTTVAERLGPLNRMGSG